MLKANKSRWFLLLLGLTSCAIANAGHPLISDDPYVQGAYHHQFEINTDKTLEPLPLNGVMNMTYSYGVSDDFDLFFNLSGKYTGLSGQADSSVGLKYLIATEDERSWDLKVTLIWPNGNHAKGLGGEQKQVVVTLTHSRTSDSLSLLSNATLTLKRSVQASDSGNTQFSVSQALIYHYTPELRLVFDAGVGLNDQKSRTNWNKQAVLGAIYSPHKNCDLDLGVRWQQLTLGWQRSLGLGLTWRL